MGTEKMGSLMLGASVPIFARSRQLKMRDEAVAMRSMAEADLRSMRSETRGRMIELYADYTKARNLRALYTTTVLPQAEATVTASFAAYRVGDVNLMTLLDNQMTVNRYREELIALDAEQGKVIAEMEMLLGRELFNPAGLQRSTQ
jgi:outer membrane protein TolC